MSSLSVEKQRKWGITTAPECVTSHAMKLQNRMRSPKNKTKQKNHPQKNQTLESFST